jgi:hypothetical protein
LFECSEAQLLLLAQLMEFCNALRLVLKLRN